MRKKLVSLALAIALALTLVPAASAAPAGIAKASTQSVEVDGQSVQFQMYALESADGLTNYVKLRDVAHVLSGTPAKFSVGYDGVISITTGADYTDNGSEMTTPFSGDRAYQPGPGSVKVNGADVTLDAIVLTDDSGGAYTYFKLRDLGTALGFKVDWSGERGVFIETGAPVTPVPAAEKDLTLADLQGSWLYVNPLGTAETELTISGDTFTYTHYVKESGPNNPEYYLYYTAPVTLKKETADRKYSFLLGGEGDIPEYQVTAGNAELWEYGHVQAGDIVFPIREYGDGWFMAADRFEKSPSPKYHGQIKAIVNAAKEKADAAQAAISKYHTYAEWPGVPDFTSVTGIPLHKINVQPPTPTGNWEYDDLSKETYDTTQEIVDLTDAMIAAMGMGVYSYNVEDAGSAQNLLAMRNEYVEVLKECGFIERTYQTRRGQTSTGYQKDGVLVTVSEEIEYGSTIYVTLQKT